MKIKAPEGWTNFSMMGVEYILDVDGTIEMPSSLGQELIDRHGFTLAPRSVVVEAQAIEAPQENQ